MVQRFEGRLFGEDGAELSRRYFIASNEKKHARNDTARNPQRNRGRGPKWGAVTTCKKRQRRKEWRGGKEAG
jgi:hypothetical protein